MTREVDNQLRIFQDLNSIMERTGDFVQAGKAGGSKEDLLKMVRIFPLQRLCINDHQERPACCGG